jgi:hypothetical protein
MYMYMCTCMYMYKALMYMYKALLHIAIPELYNVKKRLALWVPAPYEFQYIALSA